MNILVTGGAGYIGSHTVVELLLEGHKVIVVDNFINSSNQVLSRIELLTNKSIISYNIDLMNKKNLRRVFEKHPIDVCIHFASLKSVGESIYKPLEYYKNNLLGTLTLLEVMKEFKCKNLIFSSSATVYGNPNIIPITEECPRGEITNPYGHTKAMIEQILTDLTKSDIEKNETNPWNIVLLRYFNPIGAHKSGLIGEDPKGIPNNIMPYITQVALGKLEYLKIFGNDYDTPDGTGVRDYVHVVDLARGHVHALKAIEEKCGLEIFNLGTGKGYSVLDLVNAFEMSTGVKVPFKIVSRRPGDISMCYADVTKAKEQIDWVAKFDINDMCLDSWNWQKMNPNGYEVFDD